MYAPLSQRLKGLMDKDEQESEVIKDSPDSPEPLNKKPRLTSEEIQPPERSKGTNSWHLISFHNTIQKRGYIFTNLLTFYHSIRHIFKRK